MSISQKDRYLMVNQLKILAILEPVNKNEYDNQIEILTNGWVADYPQCMNIVDSEEIPLEDCNEVRETLSMFQALKRGYDSLADKTGIDGEDLVFEGYDGNKEPGMLGYVRHQVNKVGHFRETLNGRKGHFDFNSHSSASRDVYNRMLELWNRNPNKYSISRKEDIIAILATKTHPENR